jgi:hypothetical protein
MTVFFSYAQSDRNTLDRWRSRLMELLGESSQEVFLDPVAELLPGEDVRSRIRNFVHECSYVVVLWSTRAAESDWVQYELAMADALGKRIVVFKDERAPELPPILEKRQVITLQNAV